MLRGVTDTVEGDGPEAAKVDTDDAFSEVDEDTGTRKSRLDAISGVYALSREHWLIAKQCNCTVILG